MDDCLKVIKRHHFQEAMEQLKLEMTGCTDPDAKRELLKKYQETFQKSRELETVRSQAKPLTELALLRCAGSAILWKT